MTLSARGPVADVANRVDRFTGPAGGDQDRPAQQGAGFEEPDDGLDHGGRIGQPTLADVAAGEASLLRCDDDHPARSQDGHVVLDRWVLPHLGVHGRTDDDRGRSGDQGGREQIGRAPGPQIGEDAGGGRTDDDGIRRLPHRGVGYRVGVTPQAGLDRLGSQGGERGRPDHVVGRVGQDRDDVGAEIDQAAAHLDRLVRGDATGHAQHDAAASEHSLILVHRSFPSAHDVVAGPRASKGIRPIRRRLRRRRRPRSA